jgi:hypothetical protein
MKQLKNETFSMATTLLFASDDNSLKLKLQSWCKEHDKVIYYAKPDTADLIAIPSFATVVSIEFISKNSWQDFVNFQNEIDENYDNIIIIDETTTNEIITRLNKIIKQI